MKTKDYASKRSQLASRSTLQLITDNRENITRQNFINHKEYFSTFFRKLSSIEHWNKRRVCLEFDLFLLEMQAICNLKGKFYYVSGPQQNAKIIPHEKLSSAIYGQVSCLSQICLRKILVCLSLDGKQWN